MNAVTPNVSRALLSTDALAALRRAATNETTWRAAQRDPAEFLRKRRITIPDGLQVALYDLSVPRSGLVVHADEIERPRDNSDESSPRMGLVSKMPEGWWEATHEGCPARTYPFKMFRDVLVCLRMGVQASGLEWVPISEGSPFGHFEHANRIPVCLLSKKMKIEVIECLPFLLLEIVQ